MMIEKPHAALQGIGDVHDHDLDEQVWIAVRQMPTALIVPPRGDLW